MRFRTFLAAATAFLLSPTTTAIGLDLSSVDSIKQAAKTLAYVMVNSYYVGNETGQTPGVLIAPYYWWEAGAMFGTLIDYWYYTGDDTYNDITTQGLLFQASPTKDFMPNNQTTDEGNDDQDFWGFAAMTAAEYRFPNPPPDQPQWLALAQGVWNSQAQRWDTSTCHGGLRWQIFTWNIGYTYKNSPANGGFMNLGARLYAYTGNKTYAHWVDKTWDWMTGVGLISGYDTDVPGYNVYDGAEDTDNCTGISKIQWTYSAGMVLNAAAVMWNVTQDPIWETRAMGIWHSSLVFFPKGQQIMVEVACTYIDNCDTDQLSFKATFSRFIAASTKWMPQLYPLVQPYLAASAAAAAQQCDGSVAPHYNDVCGFKWEDLSKWDGNFGCGQQMSALEVVQANLIQEAGYPVTRQSGGISVGNPSAGTGSNSQTGAPLGQITTGDKAGAGVLTAVVLIIFLGGTWWIIV